MGYSALQSGLSVSPRGLGAMASMVMVGLLVRKIDARLLMAFGFALLGASTWMLGNISLEIGMSSVVMPNILNGFAMGFVFVPLTTSDAEPPAQAGDGQRHRHLQPDAQHRRLRSASPR
jgi:DHA2 family multidrug resistance protein